ncbi:DUF6612 family protein [Paenibacillus apiarius]|uniref:Lipoprotein n=1 Tax=Paenibacillus apiarius TaxID=46240 RepID=A0ABT4DZX7_9BACL|nr:DUF6612 family protein [Paenibacillus apiarius]MBN3524387.1 hypothetical protein [Paenibacillus apiarius]MCY9516572.1 hypothetical protein [Paenibacillus apiarius]MCY9522891.1 hypothetical protein [Paenibacillus apiarius]MCY9555250.1 hypothetical protein [Paenibacillus apiarius]MCY9560760.1 hypothetical protein [Paenibacillus apiarius]
MNRWMKSAVAIVFAFALIITGCGAKSNPKEAVEGAFGKSLEMKSYSFNSSIKIDDFLVNAASATSDPNAQMVMSMLKNAELSVNGVVQQEPLQMEANLEVNLKGDMALTFTLPIVMNQDKIWVKVPNIPTLPLPQDLVGKFIELDLKQLAEESGEPLPTAADIKNMQKFSNDLFKAIVGKFDEKTFFSTVDKKDAGLPDTVKAKEIVKFNVTNENFEQFATTFAKDALPAITEVVSKEEYRKLLQIEQSDIDEMKKELQSDDNELKKGIEEIKKTMKINELSLTTAIDKDQFPAYQQIVANLEFTENGQQAKIAARITNEYTNINGKAEFKIGIPTDVVTMEQLEQMFGGY